MFGKKNDPEAENKAAAEAAGQPPRNLRDAKPTPRPNSGPLIGDVSRRLDVNLAPGRRDPRPVGDFRPADIRPVDQRPDVRPVEARPDVRPAEPQLPQRGAAPQGGGDGEMRKLIVGRDIHLQGEIRACQKLVVEGRVEAALNDCRSVEIAGSGLFKGSARIETADISGRFEGDIIVTNRLIVRSTGRIVGSIQYGQIEIERGGVVSGQVEVLGGEPTAGTSTTSSWSGEQPAPAEGALV